MTKAQSVGRHEVGRHEVGGHGRASVILADDHEIVRAGLKTALEKPGVVTPEGLHIVAEAEDGLAALALVKQYQPDLLILDITMPLSSGAEIFTDIKRWSPDTKVVIFSSVTNGTLIGGLISSGVDGMFSKNGRSEEFFEKLSLILRGGHYIAPDCLALVKAGADLPALTPRERQTMQMILRGLTTKEIADHQGISPRTAEKHRANLMNKLEVKSVAALMAKALKEGLLDE